jgi:hypothetical protein
MSMWSATCTTPGIRVSFVVLPENGSVRLPKQGHYAVRWRR